VTVNPGKARLADLPLGGTGSSARPAQPLNGGRPATGTVLRNGVRVSAVTSLADTATGIAGTHRLRGSVR
jgi:hypothetical protein